MKVKSRIKSGKLIENHNQTRLRIRSRIKAGVLISNHNQTR
jgi:hypothetical protein